MELPAGHAQLALPESRPRTNEHSRARLRTLDSRPEVAGFVWPWRKTRSLFPATQLKATILADSSQAKSISAAWSFLLSLPSVAAGSQLRREFGRRDRLGALNIGECPGNSMQQTGSVIFAAAADRELRHSRKAPHTRQPPGFK